MSPKVDPRGQVSTPARLMGWVGVKGRRNPVAKRIVNMARYVVRGYDGANAVLQHIATNGENWVLTQLGPQLDVVFDVGANVGEWTKYALAAGAREVHAFEISPTTAAQLRDNHGSDARVHINSFGLSDEAGTITIRHFPDLPVLTTMTDFPWEIESEQIEVPVRTGDDYIAENGVDKIDFLKIDVEGAEEKVLHGFANAFERGAIGAVQFEYGKFVVLTKYMLRDFYADLTKWGFLIGRILPTAWEAVPFNLAMETLTDANYLAVHESRTDLLNRLK
ncbi:MAG TPA: FkbM family methyltransferase [Acidimicrobiales bacterium]|nr:FkbM family methyltransferase [Acidimicrobiales bacterium]